MPQATAPAHVPQGARSGIQAALDALENASTAEEAVAFAMSFAELAAAGFTPGADPLSFMKNMFDADVAETAMEVGLEAAAEIEAEAAAAGGEITQQAAMRVTRNIVRRMAARAARRITFAPRAVAARSVRRQRAPRARRVPRRAVRLSAVASAGDGPPPPPPPRSDADPPERAPCLRAFSLRAWEQHAAARRAAVSAFAGMNVAACTASTTSHVDLMTCAIARASAVDLLVEGHRDGALLNARGTTQLVHDAATALGASLRRTPAVCVALRSFYRLRARGRPARVDEQTTRFRGAGGCTR